MKLTSRFSSLIKEKVSDLVFLCVHFLSEIALFLFFQRPNKIAQSD